MRLQWNYKVGVILAVIIAAVLSAGILRKRELLVEARMSETQQSLAQGVFRFHVLANSDSEEDQALKMEVKEAVLSYMEETMPKTSDAAQTKAWAQEHRSEIQRVAERVIAEEGYDYEVTVKVTTCYFPDKTYGDVFFPAGEYEALRIEIGAARGQNWWCVLYPNLCFLDATHAVVPEEGKQELREVLTDDEYEMVTATSDFKIKWFFFEEE